MEHYIVSARKYRPSTFDTVVGQRPITAALKHAIATERLAHAYLFCGSRGVGKTSCARIFAKTINCTNRTAAGEACNECESCKAFNNGTSFNVVELDAASHNSVDDIRTLTEQVVMPPSIGRYRVFIIDEVHMLSAAAFNAFLKTLEEPPAHAIFVLATTEKHKIIPTILSRCQIYDFSRITIADMVQHLAGVAQKEGIHAEPAALSVIARKADGAMRDALSIFDQVSASSMGEVTYQNTIDNLNILDAAYYGRLVEAALAGDVPTALLIYKEVRDKGFDSQFFINGMALYMRDLMLAMHPATLPLLEADDQAKAGMAQVAAKCTPQFIYRAMDICNDADLNYKAASNKQFLIELALVKLCQLLSPSPSDSGDGEGQLKPIAAPAAAQKAAPSQPQQHPKAAPAPAPQAAPSTGQGVPEPMQTAEPQAPQYPQPKASQPQAAHQPRISAPGRAATPSRPMQLSIKGKQHRAAEQPAQQAAPPSALRAQPYDLAALMDAWKGYAQEHPTERILVNTMLASLPQPMGTDRYMVAVDDNIQIEAINEAKPDLLQYIRDRLSNDSIDIEARITQAEAQPVTWTQREVLEHMLTAQPTLSDLISEFGLALQ